MSDATKVDPMDPARRNSPIAVPAEEESTVALDTANRHCTWNDREFGDGERVCEAGAVYECSFGKWVKTSQRC